MRTECHGRDRPEVVDPVQMRRVSARVVASNEEVDRIGLPGSEGLCEGTTDPGCGGEGAKGVRVADGVEADVALDVFGELHGVAWCRLCSVRLMCLCGRKRD